MSSAAKDNGKKSLFPNPSLSGFGGVDSATDDVACRGIVTKYGDSEASPHAVQSACSRTRNSRHCRSG